VERLTGERSTPTSAPLPHEVQITEIPLHIIADHLETYIKEQDDALQDYAENIQKLTVANDKAKQELVCLEFEYCLARQQANIQAMTSDDTRLRLEWIRDEIARVNAEKEKALQENVDHKKENGKMRDELTDTVKAIRENKDLKQINLIHEQRLREMQQELGEVTRRLDEARFALCTVPSSVQKLCAKILVPDSGKVHGKLRNKVEMLIPEYMEERVKGQEV